MKAKIGNLVLTGLWLTMTEISASSVEVDSSIMLPLDKSASAVPTAVHGMSFPLDDLLANHKITLASNSSKQFIVLLDKRLEERLLDEHRLPDASRNITKAFVESLEQTKSQARVSAKVIGFIFLINSSTGEIYHQTFLGENAK